jgi:hypothetical protein
VYFYVVLGSRVSAKAGITKRLIKKHSSGFLGLS